MSSKPQKGDNSSPPNKNTPPNANSPNENSQKEDVKEKSMTIFRNNYIPTILPPWPETRKSHRSASVSHIKNKDIKRSTINSMYDDDDKLFENFETHVAWNGRVKYAVDELEAETARRMASKNEVFRDANRLLEITLSTIILMAIHEKVPDENYIYTSLYLQNIRDDFGYNPTNITKILQLIKNITKENNINWGEEITQNYNNNKKATSVLRFHNNKSRSRIPIRSQSKSASQAKL